MLERKLKWYVAVIFFFPHSLPPSPATYCASLVVGRDGIEKLQVIDPTTPFNQGTLIQATCWAPFF